MSNRLDNPHSGTYDDELVAHVLNALHDADGIAIPHDSNSTVTRDGDDRYSGRVRLTVAVQPDGFSFEGDDE